MHVGLRLCVDAIVAAGLLAADKPPPVARLKALHLETAIAADGRARATIVTPASGCYDALAERIAGTVRELTGAAVPVAKDNDAAGALPLGGNVIAIGNRSTNAMIAALYDRLYCLLDLRYPGRGGHVVRTLHNPLGSGHNVVFVGGSDDAGVAAAAGVLIEKLRAARKGRSVRLGRLAEIRLGEGIKVPRDIRDVRIWDASAGYRSVGYFGWNSLSKRMALYYVTGDAFHAREFLRLAFPDAAARREIAEIDGERIEDKLRPLSGPYHYNAHMMICLWDLIEESDVFTDADRLRVTRALAGQLEHWSSEWAYAARSAKPPRHVGSRHHQWAAISLYCLARYFQKHYPAPVWKRCLDASQAHFSPLHEHAWVSGESDNLFWYNTAVAPILTYMVLTGDRVPLQNGVLAKLLRGQEALISGRRPDWALRSASIGFLHKAAYLTRDGRWLTYRDRTGVDTTVFRVGQSFWPPERLDPRRPDDLVGNWTIHRLPEPKWKARRSGLPHEQSFEFASFRSGPEAGDDFVLIDGFNGASRNPYHSFAVLELRLDGFPLLRGYANQVVTRVDGLMEPKIAMDAALVRCDTVGRTAFAVAEVPTAAFANWRRTLVQRVGRYVLIVDELTFRTPGANAEVSIEWQTERWAKRIGAGQIDAHVTSRAGPKPMDRRARIHACDPLWTGGAGSRWTMRWLGDVKAGERKTFFSLLALKPSNAKHKLASLRDGAERAALRLPQPGLAVANADAGDIKAQLGILADDHVFGIGVRRLGAMLEAERPVDVVWDLAEGVVHVVAPERTRLSLALEPGTTAELDGKTAVSGSGAGVARIELLPGRHVLHGATCLRKQRTILRRQLDAVLARAQSARDKPAVRETRPSPPAAARWAPGATVKLPGAVTDMEAVSGTDAPALAVAEGSRIHLLTLDGKERQTMVADGQIRVLRWWAEHRLLLAGCADEKVIAFDETGRRKWAFVSEMDPAVLRAGKTYWFKSAPGHEGIHGLHTGSFIGGESQAFVGSACTLEILDERGRLVRRIPQFWGKVSTFRIVDGPGGTKNLLAARKYNGWNSVAIINSKTLDPRPRGFLRVPAGHTYMPGWSSMNRHHLFHEDLDGDGRREVISEINGTWNRVCVWTAGGEPRFAANFGPGPRIPARTMTDLDVCDLDGDGKKEIVAATSRGMIVALNARCQKVWAERLPAAADVLACVRPKGSRQVRLVLGCRDGSVRVLDAGGKLTARGTVAGGPVGIERLTDANGNEYVAIGTKTGGVSIFAVRP